MFVCTAFLKHIYFQIFLAFNTVSCQSTLILQEVLHDFQTNLENTANLNSSL